MEDNRKSFTIIWKIKNFTFSLNSKLGVWSPIFFAYSIFQTKWRLAIYDATDNQLGCILTREQDDFGPEQLQLDYKFYFIASDGTVIYSEMFFCMKCRKGATCSSTEFLTKMEALTQRRTIFLFEDTITVCCKMWKNQGLIPESFGSFVDSIIHLDTDSFELVFKNFSSLKKNFGNLVWTNTRHLQTRISLYIDDVGNLRFDIKLINYNSNVIYRFQFFIRDVFNNRFNCNRRLYYETPTFSIPVTFSKEFLIDNGETFLRNDILTFECDVSSTSV